MILLLYQDISRMRTLILFLSHWHGSGSPSLINYIFKLLYVCNKAYNLSIVSTWITVICNKVENYCQEIITVL
jgi:hypothetical protein